MGNIKVAPKATNKTCSVLHLKLGILRQSQAVFYAYAFFQLDGFAIPAPAQVTQSVSTPLANESKKMDVIVKTAKDVTKFEKLSWVAITLSVFIPVVSDIIIKKEVSLFSSIYWFLGIISLLIISFWILFIKNYFVKYWVQTNIEIEPVNSDDSYDGKILLKIKNGNYGDKFTEVKVELLRFIPCNSKGEYLKGGNGDYGYLDIKMSDVTFKKGLFENNFTVDSDGGSIRVEIAENADGVLKLLFDKVWDWDFLLRNEKDMAVYEYYGIAFRVSGKIAGFHFSKDFLHKIVHGINHRSMIISGQDGSERPFSKIQWVL